MNFQGVERILCPVDFDQRSHEAVDQAAAIAEPAGARLTLVHVQQMAPPLPATAARWMPLAVDPTSDTVRLEARLEDFADRHGDTWTRVERRLVPAHGSVARTIADFAERTQTELIVVGRRRRGRLARLMFGSVVSELIERAKQPLLIVPERAHA